MIASINPFTGQTIKIFEPHSRSEVELRLELADQVFRSYRKTPFARRAAKLARVADILENDKSGLAAIMTEEMGKTLRSAEAEVAKCALVCRYYAETGAEALADARLPTNGVQSFVKYQPLGPVLAVMPWISRSGRFFASRLRP